MITHKFHKAIATLLYFSTQTRFSGIELASFEDISNNGSILNLNLYVKPGVRFYNCTPYDLRIIAPFFKGGWGDRARSHIECDRPPDFPQHTD